MTGIGGTFFFSDNPNATKERYSKNLGLETNHYGSSFEFRNTHRPYPINFLQWSPFKTNSTYFSPSKKEYMINYKVEQLEELIQNLKNNGMTILDEIKTYVYGKFVRIMDADGNKIDL